MCPRQSRNRQSALLSINNLVNINIDDHIDEIAKQIDEVQLKARPIRLKPIPKVRVIGDNSKKGRPVTPLPFKIPEPLEGKAEKAFTEKTLASIGNVIRNARKSRAMTQKMVYESAGLDPSYYGHLELGEVAVSIVNLAKIARAMNTNLKDLFAKIED